jgi:sugar phosphate isomerase/epimerase
MGLGMVATLSLCNEVIRALDFPRQCAFAAAIGYDGLEIAPFTLFEPPDFSPARVAEVRSAAAAAGVAITGLHWLLAAPAGLSITSAEPAVTARTLDFGRRLVGLCAELGAVYLVHGSPAQRRLEPGREAEGRARATAYFAAMGAAAAEAGVLYLIEPLAPCDSDFIHSVGEAAAIVDAVGSPGLATMLDCAAAARAGEDVAAELRRWIATGQVRHIHFNDPNGRGPGEGALAFGPILDALAAHGYDGTAAVEPFIYEPDGMAVAARAAGYLRGLMERRRANVPRTAATAA